MSRSGSSSGRGQTILTLKELHLTPHHIYMIKQTEDFSEKSFTLRMSKGDIKISQTSEIEYINPTEYIKYPALGFSNVRFVFNVKALFEDQPAVKIQMKLLAQSNFSDKEEIEEFQINLLHYSYQHSRDRAVIHKENSIGRTRKYVLNYSFSAIYGKAFDEAMILQKMQESIIEEESKIKTNSKLSNEESKGFQIIVKEPLATKQNNILAIVEAVAQTGVGLGVPGARGAGTGWEETVSDRSYFSSSEMRQTEMISNRKVPRSILMVDNNPLAQSAISCMTEPQIAEQIQEQGSVFGTWLLLFIFIILIYFLMHPNKRV